MKRVAALLSKDLLDLRGNPGIFWPALLTGGITILMPFLVVIVVPAVTGERLSDSSDLEVALEMYRSQPWTKALDPEAAIQASVLQQFLILLVLAPVAAAMSIAAHSVIGEKQARTLEPLLSTPITTFELLAAKVLAAFLPALALSVGSLAVYAGLALAFAEPGVTQVLLAPRSLAVLLVIGPLASLTALQLAVCVSSRVNDSRSAQQIGALVVLPIGGLLVAQVMGALVLTVPIVLSMAAVLAAIKVALVFVGIAVFDRETILTRWK